MTAGAKRTRSSTRKGQDSELTQDQDVLMDNADESEKENEEAAKKRSKRKSKAEFPKSYNQRWAEKQAEEVPRKKRVVDLDPSAPENPRAPTVKKLKGVTGTKKVKGSNKSLQKAAESAENPDTSGEASVQQFLVPPGTEPLLPIDPRFGFRRPSAPSASPVTSRTQTVKQVATGTPNVEYVNANTLVGVPVAASAVNNDPGLHEYGAFQLPQFIDPALLVRSSKPAVVSTAASKPKTINKYTAKPASIIDPPIQRDRSQHEALEMHVESSEEDEDEGKNEGEGGEDSCSSRSDEESRSEEESESEDEPIMTDERRSRVDVAQKTVKRTILEDAAQEFLNDEEQTSHYPQELEPGFDVSDAEDERRAMALVQQQPFQTPAATQSVQQRSSAARLQDDLSMYVEQDTSTAANFASQHFVPVQSHTSPHVSAQALSESPEDTEKSKGTKKPRGKKGKQALREVHDVLGEYHERNGTRRPPNPAHLQSIRDAGVASPAGLSTPNRVINAADAPNVSVSADVIAPPTVAELAQWTAEGPDTGQSKKTTDPKKYHFYGRLWKRVLDLAKLLYRLFLVLKNGFPDKAEGEKEALRCLFEALRSHGEKNGRVEAGYFPKHQDDMVAVIYEDGSNFRTEIKAAGKPLVREHYEVKAPTGMSKGDGVNHVKNTIGSLVDNNADFLMHVDSEGIKHPFDKPALKSLCGAYLYGPGKLATVFTDSFKPEDGVPLRGMALGGTVLANCLDEYETGEHNPEFFYAKEYRDLYNDIYDDLVRAWNSATYGEEFQEMVRVWAEEFFNPSNRAERKTRRRFKMDFD